MGKQSVTPKRIRGPRPDVLTLPGDWREAITEAIKKPRPATGWPAKAKRPKKAK
jgi:hypothetical protein